MQQNGTNEWIDPYKKRRSEVVLTGYGADGQICYQEVITYEDYYEEVGHVFDTPAELTKRGIRRMHFLIWDSRGRIQSEAENEHDETGSLLGGRLRENPQQQWSEYDL